MGTWSESRLKEVLATFKHSFPGGQFVITEVNKLKGEASVSVRKGKKIVSYDYQSLVKWEITVKDGEGQIIGTIKGEYEMPEISSDIDDDGDEWEIKSSIKSDEGKL